MNMPVKYGLVLGVIVAAMGFGPGDAWPAHKRDGADRVRHCGHHHQRGDRGSRGPPDGARFELAPAGAERVGSGSGRCGDHLSGFLGDDRAGVPQLLHGVRRSRAGEGGGGRSLGCRDRGSSGDGHWHVGGFRFFGCSRHRHHERGGRGDRWIFQPRPLRRRRQTASM